MIPKIVVKTYPNRCSRSFDLNMAISESRIEHFEEPFNRASTDKYLKELGPLGAHLVRRIMRIPGVRSIFIHPHEISLHIGEAFDWDMIEPRAIHILKGAFAQPQLVQLVNERGGEYIYNDRLRHVHYQEPHANAVAVWIESMRNLVSALLERVKAVLPKKAA